MNKKIFIPILGLLAFMLIPNPVMGQVANYGYYGQPKQTYIESHYGIQTCDNSFQYKFLCDRVDVIIQQNDQIISDQNTIKGQNEQLIKIETAQVCMTGYEGQNDFKSYASYFGINCDVGKK